MGYLGHTKTLHRRCVSATGALSGCLGASKTLHRCSHPNAAQALCFGHRDVFGLPRARENAAQAWCFGHRATGAPMGCLGAPEALDWRGVSARGAYGLDTPETLDRCGVSATEALPGRLGAPDALDTGALMGCLGAAEKLDRRGVSATGALTSCLGAPETHALSRHKLRSLRTGSHAFACHKLWVRPEQVQVAELQPAGVMYTHPG